jgi:hypothetical protein
MYRTRLVCATYVRMNILPLLGGEGVGPQTRRLMYIGEKK